jgi:hypothetical protein
MRLAALIAPLMLAAGAQAADPSGQIEICRVLTAGDRHQGEAIEIPEGATFGDGGAMEGDQRSGNYWPLWLATMEKLTLGAGDKCVTGRARITANLDHHALRAGDHRWFVPSGTAIKPRDDWPSNYDVAATVKADFR